jgi:hypothetical protein
MPVLTDVQATADTSGNDEFISTDVPRSNTRARLGRSPDFVSRWRRGSGEPSRPRMKSLGGVFEERKKRTFVANRLDKDLGITAAYRAVMTRRTGARGHAPIVTGSYDYPFSG